mgnify:CR=1 FL=1
MLDFIWTVIKWIVALWVLWKIAEVIYFATTCGEEDKERIRTLWAKSPGLVAFVTHAAPIVAAGKKGGV